MHESAQKQRAENIKRYLDHCPEVVGDRAIMIADTAKLMALLLEDSLGTPAKDIPVQALVDAAIFACSESVD